MNVLIITGTKDRKSLDLWQLRKAPREVAVPKSLQSVMPVQKNSTTMGCGVHNKGRK